MLNPVTSNTLLKERDPGPAGCSPGHTPWSHASGLAANAQPLPQPPHARAGPPEGRGADMTALRNLRGAPQVTLLAVPAPAVADHLLGGTHRSPEFRIVFQAMGGPTPHALEKQVREGPPRAWLPRRLCSEPNSCPKAWATPASEETGPREPLPLSATEQPPPRAPGPSRGTRGGDEGRAVVGSHRALATVPKTATCVNWVLRSCDRFPEEADDRKGVSREHSWRVERPRLDPGSSDRDCQLPPFNAPFGTTSCLKAALWPPPRSPPREETSKTTGVHRNFSSSAYFGVNSLIFRQLPFASPFQAVPNSSFSLVIQ